MGNSSKEQMADIIGAMDRGSARLAIQPSDQTIQRRLGDHRHSGANARPDYYWSQLPEQPRGLSLAYIRRNQPGRYIVRKPVPGISGRWHRCQHRTKHRPPGSGHGAPAQYLRMAEYQTD